MTENIYTIDATGQSLGRVASEAAHVLMGKDSADFQKHVASDVQVHITNASKMQISQKKMKGKEYQRYTGYPSGLRKEPLGSLLKRRGYNEALRRAVRGMLPSNKLRPVLLKQLTVEE